MIATETLQRYIALCDNIIETNDTQNAEKLENEIIAVFGNEIKGIRTGLSNYSPCFWGSTPYGTISHNTDVDYIEDVGLLKNRLQAELEKNLIEFSKPSMENKMKKVFISHASTDKPFVELLVNLLEDIGLSENEIVCSSIPGYGIPLGKDIYDWLSEQFQNCELHIIFVLSENYYNSVACLNEMGAAWVLKQKYDTLLLPEFDFPQIKRAINPQQIGIKLDSDPTELNQRLNELKDGLIEEFELKSLSASKWERHRNEFVNKATALAEEACDEESDIFEDEENSSKNIISKESAVLLIYAANDPTGQIIMLRTLCGLSVNAGRWNFVDSAGGAREETRWKAAVEELENYGLISACSYKREIFSITNNGYKVADEIKTKLNINTDNSPEEYLVSK